MSIEDQFEDDDRRFERELRRFAPLTVDPLPVRAIVTRRWFSRAIATAALILLGIIGMLWRSHKTADRSEVPGASISASQITLGESQAALKRAPSFDAAISQLEREGRLRETTKAHGKHSAFEVLGRDHEKIHF